MSPTTRPRVGLAMALLLPGLLIAPGALPAQEASTAVRAEAPGGWLGIRVRRWLACDQSETVHVTCDLRDLVDGVVVDAPAARAGIRPGDTLVAIDGIPFGSAAADAALTHLRPGARVHVVVGRDGERDSLVMTAAPRPGRLDHLRLIVDSGLAASAAPAPSASASLELQRLNALQRRMQEVHDSVLQTIQVRLDSLRLSRLALSDSVAAREARAQREHGVRAPSAVPAPAPDLPEPGPGRLAGAEFQRLNPGLAPFFGDSPHGLLVLRVIPGTPADALGLRPGDVVVEAGGRKLEHPAELRQILGQAAAEGVKVKWMRKGKEMQGLFELPAAPPGP